MYTTNSAEACLHVLQNSQANIVVVEDAKQMDKVRSIWDKLPLLKAAIQWDGEIDSSMKNTYTVNIIDKLKYIHYNQNTIHIFFLVGTNDETGKC